MATAALEISISAMTVTISTSVPLLVGDMTVCHWSHSLNLKSHLMSVVDRIRVELAYLAFCSSLLSIFVRVNSSKGEEFCSS